MSTLPPNKVLISDINGGITVSNIDAVEIANLDGLLVNVQQSLYLKQDKLQGPATDSAPTVDRVVITEASGRMITSRTSASLLTGLPLLDTGGASLLSLLASKAPAVTFQSPIILTGSTVSLAPASASVSGYLGSGDFARFNGKQDALLAATSSRSGFLSASDWTLFNGKQSSIVGAASSVVTAQLAAERILVSTLQGKIAASPVSSYQLDYMTNVRADLQAQIDGKQAFITGSASSVTTADLTSDTVLVSDGSGKIKASNIATSKLNFIGSLTSDAQAQINNRQSQVTGAGSTVVSSNLPAFVVVVTNSSGKLTSSNVSTTSLGFLNGVTSNIQEQLNEMAAHGGPIGFYGATPTTKPTVVGSIGGNTALQSLITALATLGLIHNTTTA